MARLKIAFVTAEVTPFARTGGLGDVSAALPKYLHESGHDVRVFAPLYSRIAVDDYDFAPVAGLQNITMRGAQALPKFSVFAATLPGSTLPVHFIHCPELYDRPGLYTRDADEHVRFVLLTRAAIETSQRLAWAPELRDALLTKLDHPETPIANVRALVERHASDPELSSETGNLTVTHLYLWLGDYDSVGTSDDQVTTTIVHWDRYPPTFRNSPGMKLKIEKMGVTAYWRAKGFPPQCRPVGGNDFTCD